MSEGESSNVGEFLIADALPEQVFTPEDFTKEQQLIGKSAEEFGLGELVRRSEELAELNPELVKSLLKKAGQLGFLSTDMPEDYGGSELSKATSILVAERIGQGITGFWIAYSVHTGIGSLPIVFHGSQEQKERYLPKLATGEMIGAFALTEADSGSDALAAKTTADTSGDGKHYILNGQKQFISNAGFADLFITFAQVDGTKFTSFIVERKWDGISVDQEEKKMGMHGTSTRAVIFRDVKVPVENVLGEVGRGHVVAFNTLSASRLKLAPFSVGLAKFLIGEGIRYAKNRIQFGKPICEFGLIRHKIAEMVIRTYVSESMAYRSAGLLDIGLEEIDPSDEGARQKAHKILRRYALECSISKVFSSEMLDYVADECVQIMGGYGYIGENPAESAYRDSRINRIWEGTNEINRLFIVDALVKDIEMGKFPLADSIREINADVPGRVAEAIGEEKTLRQECEMVGAAKRICLQSFAAAIHEYGERIGREQEIAALIADIIIEIFAMESALLRTLKKMQKEGKERSDIHIAAAQVYISDSFPKLLIMARHIFAAIFRGEELRGKLAELEKLARYTPINTISLRRKIVSSVVPIARYHLTKT